MKFIFLAIQTSFKLQITYEAFNAFGTNALSRILDFHQQYYQKEIFA